MAMTLMAFPLYGDVAPLSREMEFLGMERQMLLAL